MSIITKGIIKKILSEKGDIILEKLINFSKDEWEKFKIDFDLAFVKYLKKSYEKYSKIKTILYRTEPKYIYDFFEVPYLKFESSKKIKADNIDDIISISKFILIQGTGGIGKSTLIKHLFINELEKKDYSYFGGIKRYK